MRIHARTVLVAPVLFFALLTLPFSGSAQIKSPPPAPGKLVAVGGHEMHFLCAGSGSPTVVVESGLGDFSTDWSLVLERVSKFTRICAYDRAGYAWSEPGPLPRTLDQINLELRDGLKQMGERGPFVLVGHSYGGLVARNFALVYRQDTAGLVLVDTVQEDQRIQMGPQHAGRIRDYAKGRPIPAPRLNVKPEEMEMKSVPPATEGLDADHQKLPKEDRVVDLWAEAQPSLEAAENSQREWSGEYMAQWRSTLQGGILGALPLLVMTRQNGGWGDGLDAPATELEAERLRTQAQLTELSTNSAQTMVRSGHQMHLEVPDRVAASIRVVVEAVRTKGSVGIKP